MTRRNHIPNPSFESDVNGWSSSDSSAALVRTGGSTSGSMSCAYDVQSTGDLAFYTTSFEPVSPGQTWTVSLDVFRFAGSSSTDVRIDMDWHDSAGNYLSTDSRTWLIASGAWRRISNTSTAPAGAGQLRRCWIRWLDVTVLGEDYFHDSVMLEQVSSPGTYGDGDTAGWKWDGTAHASSSRNTTPTADAGPDQTGVTSGSVVQLDGTGSTDPEDIDSTLAFSWSVFSDGGTGLADGDLTGRTTSTPSFTAPTSTTTTDIVLSLVVTDDGGLGAVDYVVVSVLGLTNPALIGEFVAGQHLTAYAMRGFDSRLKAGQKLRASDLQALTSTLTFTAGDKLRAADLRALADELGA